MQIGIWATALEVRVLLTKLVKQTNAQVAWLMDRKANPCESTRFCDVILVAPKSHIELARSMQTFRKRRPLSAPVVTVTNKKIFPPLLGSLASAGIGGSIPQEAADTFRTCLTAVSSGEYYFDCPISHDNLQGHIHNPELPGFTATLGQLEIWELLVKGLSMQKIAIKLNLTVEAIEARRRKLMRKLGIRDQQALIERAEEYKLPPQQVVSAST
jgi:DNA-binding NarL/FixJ family response regulator